MSEVVCLMTPRSLMLGTCYFFGGLVLLFVSKQLWNKLSVYGNLKSLQKSPQNLKDIKVISLDGNALRCIAWLLTTWVGDWFIFPAVKHVMNGGYLESLELDEIPIFYPIEAVIDRPLAAIQDKPLCDISSLICSNILDSIPPSISVPVNNLDTKANQESFILRNRTSATSTVELRNEVPPVAVNYDTPKDIPRSTNSSSLSSDSDIPFRYWSISDYSFAYRNGVTTPSAVAERFIAAMKLRPGFYGEEQTGDLAVIGAISQFDVDAILLEAKLSTERWASNCPLSVVDGVPVAFKEELTVRGFGRRCGTSILGRATNSEDELIVRRLRDSGMLFLGMTSMHELGLGVTGCNPRQQARNPHDPGFYTGGSSSGSAAAVASGLCPVALGSDGGGSIRVPAALCGVVGLKPTFGRFSVSGVDVKAYTFISRGCICASVRDAAIVYGLCAGPDPVYHPGLVQPQPLLPRLAPDARLEGIRVGVDWDYTSGADPDIGSALRSVVQHVTDLGGTVHQVKLTELEAARVAHVSVISAEVGSDVSGRSIMVQEGHHLNPETVCTVLSFAGISSTNYIQACRQRTRAMRQFREIFRSVDCLLLPATKATAYPISDRHLACGFSDAGLMVRYMHYAYLGNLTGLPGIVIPGYYDGGGLPIGIQLMAAWWREEILLEVANVLEQRLPLKKPSIYVDLMS